MAQARFATEVLNLSAGILPQFFTGLRPLRLEIAKKFAEALGCRVSDFSLRLAQEAEDSDALVRWPFANVSYEAFIELEEHERILAEAALRAKIVELRAGKRQSGQDLSAEPVAAPASKGALQRRRS
jgi:hypothetical protein